MSRSAKLVLALAVLAVVLIPVAAVASHQFTDVPDGNIFHDDISWLADSGVTKGCNPPTNDKYCPSSNVTREQMAAFLRRLATNRVVDADAVDGLQADDLAPSVLTAVDDDLSLDLSTNPVVCQTGDFVPTHDMTALLFTEMSVEAPGAGSIQWGTKAAYSTDGGSSWINATPDWWLRVTSHTGEYNGVTSNGAVELAAGTTYRFGQRATRFSGQSTTDEYICKTLAQIVPRTATTGVQSAVVAPTAGLQLDESTN